MREHPEQKKKIHYLQRGVKDSFRHCTRYWLEVQFNLWPSLKNRHLAVGMHERHD